jgi:uncharacterized protein YjiS (DUF1127 family)
MHIAANERGAPTDSKEMIMTMLNNTSSHFARSTAMPAAKRGAATAFLASLARLINDWIADVIAQRERQATLVILRKLGDRELSDIGLSRSQIGEGLSEAEKDRMELQASRRR